MWGVIAVLISITLVFLSGLHFYWALFGVNDIAAVVPTDPNKGHVISPGKGGSALVGVLLLLFALVFINKIIIVIDVPWLNYIAMTVGILFLIRAIGDFKYVGFTKKIRNSKFSRLDSQYYSPFCLVLGILILLNEFFS